MGISDLTPTIAAIAERAEENKRKRRLTSTGNNTSITEVPTGGTINVALDDDPNLPPERPGDDTPGGQELSPPLLENISIVQELVQPNISSATVKVSVDIIIDEDGEKYEVNWVTA